MLLPAEPGKIAAVNDLVEKIQRGEIANHGQLEREKILVSKKYSLSNVVKNADIIPYADPELIKFLRTKPVRTLSGVANISVMWLGERVDGKPYSCPFKCIYCAQGNNAPKSYIGVEPTTLRAIRNNYDPYLQIKNRLNQLHLIGHPQTSASS